MRPLLWLQLLLVFLGSEEILGDEVPTDSTTIIPTPAASQADGISAHVDSIKPEMYDQAPSEADGMAAHVDSIKPEMDEQAPSEAVGMSAHVDSIKPELDDQAPSEADGMSAHVDSIKPEMNDQAPSEADGMSAHVDSIKPEMNDQAPSEADGMSSHVDSIKPEMEDQTVSQADGMSAHDYSMKPEMDDQTASALHVYLAVDGTTNAPVPSVDIESADPIPLTSKKRSSDGDAVAADGESAYKAEPKQDGADYDSDPKQNENILLIDKARRSRESEASTTPQPQSTAPKKRQDLMESSESVETLPLNVINGIRDASANAYFNGDPKRRVSLSHDEFSQMLNQVLQQNQIYGNVQQDNLQSYLRPLQVEKYQDNDKDSEYLDDGRQTGFQVEDQRNNDGPIYISVPLNKDFKQLKPKLQKQFQVRPNMDVVLTPETKRPPIDPPTEVIQQQQIQQQQIRPAIKDLPISPVLPGGAPPPPAPSISIVPAPSAPLVPSNPIVPAPPPPPTPSIHIIPAPPAPLAPSNPIVPAPPAPPAPSIHIDPAPPPPPVLSNPIVPAPVGTVLPANPNTPGQPPVNQVINANPSAPHVPQKPPFNPTKPPGLKLPPVSPVGHVHNTPPVNNAVLKPSSPNNEAIAVPIPQSDSTISANVTAPHSCPTLVEFLNASRNVWQGIATAGGLQAGLGVFFKAAGKVITTLTQCAKSILSEIGTLFYQGVVEKMMAQLEEKPNVMSASTPTNIKTMDGRRQVADQKNQSKRKSPAVKKFRRYKKHITKSAAGSSVNGDFIEAQIEEMDLETEDEVTQEPGNVRGRKETENKAEEHVNESVQGNEDDTLLKVDNVEPGMY